MNVMWAFARLKEGERVRRSMWAEGCWLARLDYPETKFVGLEDWEDEDATVLIAYTPRTMRADYEISAEEFGAEDWEIYQP